MGKFLRDKEGRMVAIAGAPVLEKTLDRKPRDCQDCGFTKWIKGDKLFIVQGNVWLCPDCAIIRGLPHALYQRNHYSQAAVIIDENEQEAPSPATPRKSTNILSDIFACVCYF